MVTPVEDRSPWKIVGKREIVFDKPGVSVCCDQQLHLFKLEHLSFAGLPTTTSDSASVHDLPLNESSPRSQTISKCFSPFERKEKSRTNVSFRLVYLERIQYIQRGAGGGRYRSAKDFQRSATQRQNGEAQQKHLMIYFLSDRPRSDYLYKMISFQLSIASSSRRFLLVVASTFSLQTKNSSPGSAHFTR